MAALAGVSITWYTWLEQGRAINVSAEVLERVCRCLRLSYEERAFVFSLVQGRPAPLLPEREEHVNETLWRTIQFLPVPALVMTLRWDILAWNCLIAKVFRDYGDINPSARNLLRIILTDPKYQKDPDAYEKLARKLLAKFRVDFSQCAGDPAFDELIAELTATAPRFHELWTSSDISDCTRGMNVIQHRSLGGLSFEYAFYVPEGSGSLRLLLFIPSDAKTAAKIASLAGHTNKGCDPAARTHKIDLDVKAAAKRPRV